MAFQKLGSLIVKYATQVFEFLQKLESGKFNFEDTGMIKFTGRARSFRFPQLTDGSYGAAIV